MDSLPFRQELIMVFMLTRRTTIAVTFLTMRATLPISGAQMRPPKALVLFTGSLTIDTTISAIIIAAITRRIADSLCAV